jgi:DNA processing protein
MNDASGHPIAETERLQRLRLIRSENVGPITYYALIERFGSAAAALAALPELSRRGGRAKAVKVCPQPDAEREIEALRAAGARLIARGEPDYPPMLAAIDAAPPLIGVLGDVRMTERRAIAVVGSRNASLNGRRFARDISAELGAAGFVVVSGMARGIDAAAHQGALETGTVAVVAGGIDVVYPKENAELYAEITAHGAIISEVPPGVHPQARHFPRRNRLISGLALGVVVVEAGLHSGSLITARLALEQGREVFAVPGSPLDPRARGANHLIRQGAALTESAEDILDVVDGPFQRSVDETTRAAIEAPSPPVPDGTEVETARRTIAETLSPTPVTVDEIIRTCQLSPAVVTTVLLEWELAGRLERHPGNKVSLIAASQTS